MQNGSCFLVRAIFLGDNIAVDPCFIFLYKLVILTIP